MNPKQAKRLLPFILAFAEGKTIQRSLGGTWHDLEDFDVNLEVKAPTHLRVKPISKFRPFKDVKECWNEIQKHYPIGWTKLKDKDEYSLITDIDSDLQFESAMKEYTFADGAPFGVKVDED